MASTSAALTMLAVIRAMSLGPAGSSRSGASAAGAAQAAPEPNAISTTSIRGRCGFSVVQPPA